MKPSSRVGLLASFGLLAASLAACTGTVGGGPTPSGSAGTGSGTAGATGTAGSVAPTGTGGSVNPAGVGGTGGSAPACVGTCVCVPGIPATTQIPRLTRLQYDTVVKDLLGLTVLASNSNQPPSALLADDSAGPLTDIGWNGYLGAAEKIATEVVAGANRSMFTTCAANATGAALTTCLTSTIQTFGRKAFRRPLTSTEVTSFLRFQNLTPAGTTNEIVESVLYAILASPSFIQIPELGTTAEGTALKLSSHEVAARLSFLIWNSVPDPMLDTEADAGRLTTAAQIRTQALRLLQSPKAAAIGTSFHKYYADISNGSHWTNITMHTLPTWAAGSYNAAMAELDAFFGDMVVSGGTFKDLFTSPVAFVTSATAPIYGVTSTATTPTKMMLDATRRPGFLTRVGFLSTHAHETTSSPILRGAFITQRVLAIPVGQPDPSFTGMMPVGTFSTERAATEELTKNAPCNSCHTTKVNPPGFVLERYNAVGAWQDTDPRGGAINSTAEVYFAVNPDVKKTVSTPAELMAEIAVTPNAQKAYAQQFVAFATGRSANSNDTCVVDTLATGLATPTYTIANMMADYTQADSFRLRTLGN
jgi:hypothetical protein